MTRPRLSRRGWPVFSSILAGMMPRPEVRALAAGVPLAVAVGAAATGIGVLLLSSAVTGFGRTADCRRAQAALPDPPHPSARYLLDVSGIAEARARPDDAISVLDGMRAAGELPARLEAERCRDLAKAWSQKGQAAYAEDYRLRAEALAR